MPVVTSLAIGSPLPLFKSATGFALLAFMNDDEISIAKRGEPVAMQDREIDAIRKRVRRDMFAMLDELLIPGLRAIAVPILNLQNHAALVATAMAAPAFPRDEDSKVLKRLQSACKLVTERIGARWERIG